MSSLHAHAEANTCFKGGSKVKGEASSMTHLITPPLLLRRRCEAGQLGTSLIVHTRLVHVIWMGERGTCGKSVSGNGRAHLTVMMWRHTRTREMVIRHYAGRMLVHPVDARGSAHPGAVAPRQCEALRAKSLFFKTHDLQTPTICTPVLGSAVSRVSPVCPRGAD